MRTMLFHQSWSLLSWEQMTSCLQRYLELKIDNALLVQMYVIFGFFSPIYTISCEFVNSVSMSFLRLKVMHCICWHMSVDVQHQCCNWNCSYSCRKIRAFSPWLVNDFCKAKERLLISIHRTWLVHIISWTFLGCMPVACCAICLLELSQMTCLGTATKMMKWSQNCYFFGMVKIILTELQKFSQNGTNTNGSTWATRNNVCYQQHVRAVQLSHTNACAGKSCHVGFELWRRLCIVPGSRRTYITYEMGGA